MMKKKILFKKIALLFAAILISGCAAHAPEPGPVQTALGKWLSRTMTADGSKKEWPRFSPQFKDPNTGTRMWVGNNDEILCLALEVKDQETARQVTRNGLTLAVKTREKDAKPFSIRFKGQRPFRHRTPSGNKQQNQAAPPRQPSKARLPDTLEVTYPFSSGPQTMSMKVARLSGIDFGLGQAGHHPLMLEAVISLDAIFFDVPRIQGEVVDITLATQPASSAPKRPDSHDNNKKPPPRGKPADQQNSDTGNKAPKPKDTAQPETLEKTFSVAVQVTLAGASD